MSAVVAALVIHILFSLLKTSMYSASRFRRARSEPVTGERTESSIISQEGEVQAIKRTGLELGTNVYYRAELASANFSLYSDRSLSNTT
jgi:hypothetical protein